MIIKTMLELAKKGHLDYSEQYVKLFEHKKNSSFEKAVTFYCQTLETYHILKFSFFKRKNIKVF